jgi:uncharacterized protein YndB with AHSA1/START domain
METTAEQTRVVREVRVAASPETVWEFLVDPEKIRRWKALSATLDARPGGAYRIEVVAGRIASGEIVELDPPHLLVYTWGWEPIDGEPNLVPPGASTVEYHLIPDGDGTIVQLVHRDLPNAESCASHAFGWEHYLGRLQVVGGGGDPGPDPWATGAGGAAAE